MRDPLPSGLIRLALACVAALLLWGEAGTLLGEARGDAPGTPVLARAHAARAPASRLALDAPGDLALPEPRFSVAGAEDAPALRREIAAARTERGRGPTGVGLPRAPPAA